MEFFDKIENFFEELQTNNQVDNAEVKDNLNKCKNCGAALTNDIKCQYCGSVNENKVVNKSFATDLKNAAQKLEDFVNKIFVPEKNNGEIKDKED